MIKEFTEQEDIIILYIYIPNGGIPKFIKHMMSYKDMDFPPSKYPALTKG